MDEQQRIRILPSPPPVTEVELPALINIATRKQHTELNRLIIERLPLALPPNTFEPATLGYGLAVFAKIYYTFETAWEELILDQDDERQSDMHELQQRLVDLRLEELCRTKRLQDDINHIRAITGVQLPMSSIKQQQPMLNAMAAAMRAKPHIVVAYAWVLYMAIFSGGRWIRAQLANAGPKFWAGYPPSQEIEKCEDHAGELAGFSFLRFDGDRDGEDLKIEFKMRFKAVDEWLTAGEKEDVIDAAKTLFDDCITLVRMLDSNVQRQKVARAGLWIILGIIGSLVILFRLFANR